MHFKHVLLLAALLALIGLTSCGSKTEAVRSDCKIKVGIVFDIGGKNDRSFNAAAWEGVQRADRQCPRPAS